MRECWAAPVGTSHSSLKDSSAILWVRLPSVHNLWALLEKRRFIPL